MNIDIKDLVLIGGGVFTLAIIVHGIWLAWRSRQDPLRLDIEPDLVPEDGDELARFRGELPNGGGRVVGPHQKNLDFDQGVPVLLDRVDAPDTAEGPATRPSGGPTVREAETAPTVAARAEVEPIRTAGFEPVLTDTGPIVARDPRRSRPSSPGSGQRAADASRPQPESGHRELLMISLFGQNGEQFTGEALLAAMRGQGLKFGEMNIFHCLDPETREIQFSVANVLEPGYFDLAQIADLASPGLMFFLQLPGPKNPARALEEMIRVTRVMAEELDAVLKDENRSVLTPQTEKHYRERVAEFSRRRLSARD